MRSPLLRRVRRALTVILVFALLVFLSFHLSPWPGALLIRKVFDRGGVAANEALALFVPPGLVEQLDVSYDPADVRAKLDVFLPPAAGRNGPPRVTVVWTHGGAFVSGSKAQVANYARVLAGRGFAVVAIDYALAPGTQYPAPVRQLHTALAYLRTHAGELGLDPTRFVLAGDSAGAHISAQLANALVSPDYARALGLAPAVPRDTLAGTVLFCGPYGIDGIDLDGEFGGFLRAVLWAYLGAKRFEDDPRLDVFSVARHVSAGFPPTFISAGNGDPLAPQSYALADALTARGVPVDRLFFPADHAPALGHEYQFNLTTDAGRLALERLVAFLQAR